MKPEVVLYLVLTANGIEGDWPNRDEAVPVGSLVKPFTALAYAQKHGFVYPVVECKTGCWSGRAHGRVNIGRALEQSCNVYFRSLAATLSREDVAATAARFGIAGPSKGDADTLIGGGDGWKVLPAALLKAYRELLERRSEPGVAPLLDGLTRSALSGTAKGIGDGAMGKTGTAACPLHVGDGYAIAMTKERSVLVRVHERPGSAAAQHAGEILKRGGSQLFKSRAAGVTASTGARAFDQ